MSAPKTGPSPSSLERLGTDLPPSFVRQLRLILESQQQAIAELQKSIDALATKTTA